MTLTRARRLLSAIEAACRHMTHSTSPEVRDTELALDLAAAALRDDIEEAERGLTVNVVDTEATTLRPPAAQAAE